MPKRFVAIALLVAATVFFIPSGARSAPNGKPIVIGLSIALSGEYADSAGFLKQGYDLWVKDTNAKGGLLGRPVELKIYDDQSDPQTSAKLFEKLITQDKVDLLLGPYSSAVTSAASTVAEKYQMVMLAAAAAAPGIWKRGYKYIFQVSAQSQNYYVGAIDIAKRMGYKTMDVIGEDSDYANSAVPATTAYADKNGIKTLYSQFYPVKTSDFSAFIQHVVSDNPDVFLNAGYPPEDISVLHSLRGQDANPRMIVMGIGPSQPDWPANVGKDGNWVFASVQWEPSVNTPGNKQFVAAYTKEYGRPPDYHAAQAYGALQVLGDCVRKIGSLDQQKLRDAVARANELTVFNRFQVDDTGAQIGAKLFLVQWQNGAKQVVWPFDVATAKYQLPTPPWSKR